MGGSTLAVRFAPELPCATGACARAGDSGLPWPESRRAPRGGRRPRAPAV